MLFRSYVRVRLPDGCICVDQRRNDAVRIEAQILGCPVPAKLAPYIFHLEGNSELCEEPCDLLDIGRCPAAEAPQHEALMPTEPPCRLRLQGARRRHRTIACRWERPPIPHHATGRVRTMDRSRYRRHTSRTTPDPHAPIVPFI